jgi:hypothetical protein
MRRICALGAVLAFLAGAVLAGSGLAGAAKQETGKVTLGVGYVNISHFPIFVGSINSSKKGCIAGRDIHILFQRNRGKTAYFGRTRTDSGGGFYLKMRQGMRIGGYLARAKKTSRCTSRRSGVLPVDHNNSTGIRVLRQLHRSR